MILTTTDHLEGYEIIEYCGVAWGYSEGEGGGENAATMAEAMENLREHGVEQDVDAIIGIQTMVRPAAISCDSDDDGDYYLDDWYPDIYVYGTMVRIRPIEKNINK